MLAAFLALLIALFPATLRPAGDEDGDGVANLRETIHGCDAFDAASRPVCVDLDGDGVGETEPIAPLCTIAAPGFAPCA